MQVLDRCPHCHSRVRHQGLSLVSILLMDVERTDLEVVWTDQRKRTQYKFFGIVKE